jgi:hypothetical protein
MNRCPSCRNLVPAGWIACRRCGAALAVARPVTVPRAGTITLERPAVAPVVAHAPPRLPPAPDTLLPRAERDVLLPTPNRIRRPPLSRPVALTIAAVLAALAMLVLAFGGSHGGSSNTGVAPSDPRARALLVDATAAAHAIFVQHGSFAGVTPAALAHRLHAVTVVGATSVARAGQVSAQVVNNTTFVIATPGQDGVCVFARDEPTKSRVGFAATTGSPCRAAAAPALGWRGS